MKFQTFAPATRALGFAASFSICVGLCSSVGLIGCSTSKKKTGPAPVLLVSGEENAKQAADKTMKDEQVAPRIQNEMNGIFFRDKKESPGGLNAFSEERISALESDLGKSQSPAIRYYLENRAFYDRIEDQGGGFRIAANGNRA